VLYVAHYLHQTWPDGTVTPTTINSMTPYLTGREIVGGTFSHWSPVARWLWVGDPWARVLPAQIEAEDNRRLFGVPWEEMDDWMLAEKLVALHVTTVVAGPRDEKARALLDGSRHFRRHWDNGYFTFYHLTGAPSDWIEAQGATARLVERSPRRWTIVVDASTPGATLTLKMTHYPLWRAVVDNRPIPLAANRYGLQEVTLPPDAPYTLEVVYGAGWPEWVGHVVSMASLVAVGLVIGQGMLARLHPRARRNAAHTTSKPRPYRASWHVLSDSSCEPHLAGYCERPVTPLLWWLSPLFAPGRISIPLERLLPKTKSTWS
jgi:hypothetical protein